MSPTREAARLATQQRVLEVAAQLFRERGFTSTSVRDIAEASGVSVGTVMAVGDKGALLVRVFDDLIAGEHEQQGRATDAIPGHTTACRVTRLVELVRPFVELFASHPNLARAYASILVSGTHDSHLFSDLAGKLTQEFASTAGPSKARALYFAYLGVLFSWAGGRSNDPAGITAELRTTFAAICPEETP